MTSISVNTQNSPASRVSKSSGSGRHRPRASVACRNCRKKKTKCDIQNLDVGVSCSVCRNAKVECVIVQNGDRRKHSSREHITTLQERMETIEALISEYGVNMLRTPKSQGIQEESTESEVTASATHIGSSMLSNNDESLDQDISVFAARADGNIGPDKNNVSTESDGTPGALLSDAGDWSEVGQSSSAAASDLHPPPQSAQVVASQGQVDELPSSNQAAGIDEAAPNLGADSSPGQVRYYGPTTQLHIQSQGEQTDETPTNHNLLPDFVIDMDSSRLRDVLLFSCWTYYQRSVQVVDSELFMSHRAVGKRSQYYSSFLEASLLACATRISTSQAVRNLGRAYADRAKQDLAIELEQPTIATLQGFLLLSDFEATSARDRVGWIYTGIACRLLFDLGLQEDCSHLVKHGVLTKSDANIRNNLFLAAFVYDRLWALYLGRPSCVPIILLQHGPEFPAMNEHSDTLRYWVTLCAHMSEVNDILNGPGSLNDRNALAQLVDLSLRIKNSHDLLPSQFSSAHIAELDVIAYGLNMQFCGLQIVLHRALVKMLYKQAGVNSESHLDRIEKSRAAMHENAICICRLVLAYREVFGVENFVTIMLDNMYIAASTLIIHVLQPPAADTQSMSYPDAPHFLRIVSDTMEALQKHYPVAEKMRRTLSRIIENTTLAGNFGSPDVTPQVAKSFDGTRQVVVPPLGGGSWGSMEALVHDDFFCQNSMLGESFIMRTGLEDTPWLNDLNLDVSM